MRASELHRHVFWRHESVVIEICEHFDYGRVKVSSALAQDLSYGFVDWPRLLVGSPMHQRVEYVSHRN
jgi:hypothetical protein